MIDTLAQTLTPKPSFLGFIGINLIGYSVSCVGKLCIDSASMRKAIQTRYLIRL